MILCDICGEEKRCRTREIEGKEYDICAECWAPLAAKLKGKGRQKKDEIVLLPEQPAIPEPERPQPLPGEPPKIWGGLERVR